MANGWSCNMVQDFALRERLMSIFPPNARSGTIARINTIRHLCCTTPRILTYLGWVKFCSLSLSRLNIASARPTPNTYFIHKTILVRDKIANPHNTQLKLIVTSLLCNGTIHCTFRSHRLVHNKLLVLAIEWQVAFYCNFYEIGPRSPLNFFCRWLLTLEEESFRTQRLPIKKYSKKRDCNPIKVSPRTGFIFRRIKSLFHHSNWQHIFLISFNGTSKRGVMHYNKKLKKYYFLVKHYQFAWEIVEFQSLKALPIWRFLDHFSLEKSCDRLVHWTAINIGSNWRGDFSLSVELSSFIFLLLYYELW